MSEEYKICSNCGRYTDNHTYICDSCREALRAEQEERDKERRRERESAERRYRERLKDAGFNND